MSPVSTAWRRRPVLSPKYCFNFCLKHGTIDEVQRVNDSRSKIIFLCFLFLSSLESRKKNLWSEKFQACLVCSWLNSILCGSENGKIFQIHVPAGILTSWVTVSFWGISGLTEVVYWQRRSDLVVIVCPGFGHCFHRMWNLGSCLVAATSG
jgi:hypothetical protein